MGIASPSSTPSENKANAFRAQMHTSYALNLETYYKVSADKKNKDFLITIEEHSAKSNLLLNKKTNKILFPRYEPYSGSEVQLLQLQPEVDGFTIAVGYSYMLGTDRYTLTFASTPEPVLRYFRKERFDKFGQTESGIVVDYALIKGRWLGNNPQGPSAMLPPFNLKKEHELRFELLQSVFDVQPMGDFKLYY